MLNLLPTEEKNFVRLEYRRRLWSGFLMALFFTLVSVVFLFLPSLAKINFSTEQIKYNISAIDKKPEASDYQDLTNTIKTTKSELDALSGKIAVHNYIADEIREVLRNKPDGIQVENITWLKGGNKGDELVLGGKAANRNLLSQYYNVLNSDNAFSGVALPISDLAKSEGSQFSITINLKSSSQ